MVHCNDSPALIPRPLFRSFVCLVYMPCSRLDLPPAVVLALETLVARTQSPLSPLLAPTRLVGAFWQLLTCYMHHAIVDSNL